MNLALKHFQSVQTIDTQLQDGMANLDLFTKLHAQVYIIHVLIYMYSVECQALKLL